MESMITKLNDNCSPVTPYIQAFHLTNKGTLVRKVFERYLDAFSNYLVISSNV